MTASQLLYSLLSTNPAVVALVGEKIFPVVVTQGTAPPFLRYQLITRPKQSGDCAPDVARLQISCYARVYDQVEEVEQACRLALDNYEVAGTDTEVSVLDATDLYEDEEQLFHRTLDLRVVVPAPEPA